MKRAIVLFALITLVGWLVQGAPPDERKEPDAIAAAPSSAASQSSLDPDPCGEGCDPNQEMNCIFNGGMWDPVSCICILGCDPWGTLESNCFFMGGIWDPMTCTCQPAPCNPSPPVVDRRESAGEWQECRNGLLFDCSGHYITYAVKCQDGSILFSWTEFVPVCVSDLTPCGGGGGPGGGDGGGDDCWDSWDCWCDWDWGICCDWDYCWAMDAE